MNNVEDIYRLSPMQQGMLFHTLYAPASGVYCEQMSWVLKGDLDVAAFESAWQRAAERHPVFRTAFVWEGQKEPLQIVVRQVKLAVELQDWRAIPAAAQRERIQSFMLENQRRGFQLAKAPLMRLLLIRLDDETHQFIWTFHHILLDGWSVYLVLKEVFADYEAVRNGQDARVEPCRPYRDYIAWLEKQDFAAAENFWRETLKGLSGPTPLVVDGLPTPGAEGGEGYDEMQTSLDAETTASLGAFVREHRLTLNTLIQGAWALLLSRYSGEEDVVFGLTVSGRPPALPGSDRMVGLLINTLPARVSVNADEPLLPWLREIQARRATSSQYEHSPLVQIQGWSEWPRGQSLFESILVFENFPVDETLRGPKEGLEISNVQFVEPTNYPLVLAAGPGRELMLRVTYDRSRFDGDTVERMLGHLRTLLEGMTARAAQRLKDIPLLGEAERRRLLVEWNATEADYPEDSSVRHLFEAQAERTPDAAAVIFEETQLSYRELNVRANRLAHYLRGRGTGPEVLVGICMRRSVEMLVAVLGVLKAGGAYLPLDPAYPKERLDYMIKDARVKLLLTQEDLLKSIPENDAERFCLDLSHDALAGEREENPPDLATADNLAYVTYTSGSTGKPKGIAMTQRPLLNLLAWQYRYTRPPQGARTLQFASLSFDVSFQDMFSTWDSGGTLVMIAEDVRGDMRGLARVMTDKSVHRIFIPAVALQQLAEGFCAQEDVSVELRKVIAGSEQLQLTSGITEMFTRHTECTLHNEYGPSEAHVVTSYDLPRSPADWPKRPPIGRPISNTQIYILDADLRPVPIGVPGELYIGGVCLSRGYLGHPDLTADKFIPNPLGGRGGERMYKTGDLARFLPDGQIEFLGRIDHQLKIRGFRIEPGEVEAAISQHPAIHECVVIAHEYAEGDKRLIAYLVSQQAQPLNVSEFRSFLSEKLPEYMVPSNFVMMEALPLTPNGKVDRRALPPPHPSRPELGHAYVAPRSALERALAQIWSELLGVEQIGLNDNFFEIGGHSLLATLVVGRIRDTFKVKLPLRAIFDTPTIASLSAGMMREERQPGDLERIGQLILKLEQLSEEEALTLLREQPESAPGG